MQTRVDLQAAGCGLDSHLPEATDLLGLLILLALLHLVLEHARILLLVQQAVDLSLLLILQMLCLDLLRSLELVEESALETRRVGNIRRTGECDARLSRTHSMLQLLLLLSHDLLHHKLLSRSRLGLRLTEHSAKKLLVQLICVHTRKENDRKINIK